MISVVIPHHTGKIDIRPCIEALLKQDGISRNYYEIIVVENPDRSLKLEQYGAKHLVNNTPGSNAARNLGIAAAKYDIIAIIDDDIVVGPNYIRRLIGIHGLYPNMGIVGGKVELKFNNKPKWVISLFESMLSKIDWPHATIVDIFHNPHQYLISANLSFKKSIWSKVGGFPDIGLKGLSVLSGNDEVEFIRKCGEAGYPHTLYDPDLVVQHLIPPERVSTDYFMRRSYGQGYADARDYIRNNPNKSIDDVYHDWVQGNALTCMSGHEIMTARETICHEESTREFIRHYFICKSEYLRGINECLSSTLK